MTDRLFTFGGYVAILLLVLFSYGCTAALRSHGVNSCRQRGGTPVTRSWLSHDPWDVSCIGGR